MRKWYSTAIHVRYRSICTVRPSKVGCHYCQTDVYIETLRSDGAKRGYRKDFIKNTTIQVRDKNVHHAMPDGTTNYSLSFMTKHFVLK